tara:strand:- start:1019 stop:2359 length:1341 start_codon:yes stop_codon:yes gene_type:complete
MVTEKFMGVNDLAAKMSFEERANYKEYALAQYNGLNLTDFLYKNPLYGKVDEEGFVITPKEEFLAQYSATNTVLGIDIVVEIYEKFVQSFLLELYSRYGVQNFNSNYVNFEPKVGWTSIEPMYLSYQTQLYEAFIEGLHIDKEARRKLCNMDHFLNYYLNFINGIAAQYPLTKTAFIKSIGVPPTVSGLVIDLAEDIDFSDDLIKSTGYIDDNLFDVFTRHAVAFGFSIDKNVPWRLVARPGSREMKQYLDEDDLNLEYFFKRHYNRVYEQEYYNFKIMAEQFYNSFVTAYPSEHYAVYSKTGKLRTGSYDREQAISLDISSKGESFWLEKYYNVRMLEMGKTLTRKELKQTMRLYMEFYKRYGLEALLFKMEKSLIKIKQLALPSVRKKHFNYGFLNSESGIYDGKPPKPKGKSIKVVAPQKKEEQKISQDPAPAATTPPATNSY